jgi:hypothetical protein
MHNLNYTPTTLGVQIEEKLLSGGTRTKKVEYHCSNGFITFGAGQVQHLLLTI